MKTRQKRSIVWKSSKEDFQKIINASKCIADVCSNLGLRRDGGNYTTIQKRIKEENINTSTLTNGRISKPKWVYVNKNDFLNRLTIGAELFSDWVKKKLLEFDILPYKCSKCKLEGLWNDVPLSLHLDHKNGNSTDWRLENIRFLCPNCHSQTETYGGKKQKIRYYCNICKKETAGYTNHCFSCGNEMKRKVLRPSKEKLIELFETTPITNIGKKYSVSDNAIRKWCKSYGIECIHGRGYWS